MFLKERGVRGIGTTEKGSIREKEEDTVWTKKIGEPTTKIYLDIAMFRVWESYKPTHLVSSIFCLKRQQLRKELG